MFEQYSVWWILGSVACCASCLLAYCWCRSDRLDDEYLEGSRATGMREMQATDRKQKKVVANLPTRFINGYSDDEPQEQATSVSAIDSRAKRLKPEVTSSDIKPRNDYPRPTMVDSSRDVYRQQQVVRRLAPPPIQSLRMQNMGVSYPPESKLSRQSAVPSIRPRLIDSPETSVAGQSFTMLPRGV